MRGKKGKKKGSDDEVRATSLSSSTATDSFLTFTSASQVNFSGKTERNDRC